MRFSSEKLTEIFETTRDGSCACPADVCAAILAVRQLYETQLQCLLDAHEGPLRDSHGVMAYYSRAVHEQLEECLDQVMKIEGWNPLTLEMPPEIRKLRMRGAAVAADD